MEFWKDYLKIIGTSLVLTIMASFMVGWGICAAMGIPYW